MSPGKKQILDLADEFLTDVAATFFETRCRLDAMIEAFQDAVSSLRREAERVGWAADTLWTVLIDDAAARDLLCRLKVDPAPFEAVTRKAGVESRIAIQPLWGRRRRYRFAVAEAYRLLAVAVDRYMDGLVNGAEAQDAPNDGPVYYHLVREMTRLINERIQTVNRRCSPSELLQYVKQFDPAKMERECLTGAGGGSCGLDERLCFMPLDFAALALPVFPRLTPPAQARDIVIASADAVYRDRPEAVAALLERLKNASLTSRHSP